MAALIPNATLVVIEDSGHMSPVEQPEQVSQALLRFLGFENKNDDADGVATGKEKPMGDETAPDRIPDTPLFDRKRSLRGYRINKMAMGLGDPANREAFRNDESAYLDRFGLTSEEKQAVMTRNWQEMVRLGGNLFFILKISAVDPVRITEIGAHQAGMDHADFLRDRLGKEIRMAKLIGGLGTSHVPSIGAALDKGLRDSPDWKAFFDGYIPGQEWVKQHKPDVAVVIFNDHGNTFFLDKVPTFAVGCAEEYRPVDEGWGRRAIAPFKGEVDFSWHFIDTLVENRFDPMICQEIEVDHGLQVPMELFWGKPDAWPVKVVPIFVNVIQYPIPLPSRCYEMGRVLRQAIESYDSDERFVILGTGGLPTSSRAHAPASSIRRPTRLS